MERLRLADGTEMEISEGSDLRNITTGIKKLCGTGRTGRETDQGKSDKGTVPDR